MTIEMMAVGDSIHSGMRSLTIDADLTMHSVRVIAHLGDSLTCRCVVGASAAVR